MSRLSEGISNKKVLQSLFVMQEHVMWAVNINYEMLNRILIADYILIRPLELDVKLSRKLDDMFINHCSYLRAILHFHEIFVDFGRLIYHFPKCYETV